MFEKILKHKWTAGILLLFVLLSIFLRTYHFREWLQFNPDQARDAGIISSVIAGEMPLPLLGAIAGGTHFHLGPIFYYFGIVSAFLFGDTPESIAYVDLFFSLLALPFLFFFLRNYFEMCISLALSILMGVSAFFVNISRFSWNPNSIPFFTLLFLFSLLRIMDKQRVRQYRWPIFVGISLGIGIQLHTFLLLIMPTTVFFVLIFQFIKKRKVMRDALLIFIFALMVNGPQIVSEIQTGGSNMQAFFSGSTVQTKAKSEIGKNIGVVLSCHIQTNANMLFSIENMEGCSDIFFLQKNIKKYADTPGIITHPGLFGIVVGMSILFSLFGYFLFLWYYRRETEESRKNFLWLCTVYTVISLLFFIPVASHMEPRYFVILFFVPFVLFGLCLQFLLGHMRSNTLIVFWFIIGVSILINLCVVWKVFMPYYDHTASDTEQSILGEIEPIAWYMTLNEEKKEVFLTGGRVYLKRFFDPLEYLMQKRGIKLTEYDDTVSVQKDTSSIFHIAPASSMKKRVGDTLSDRIVLDQKQFGKLIISSIE